MRWLILSLALLVAAPAHAENTRRKHAGQALTGVGIGLTVVSIMLGAARQYSWDHNGGRPACCDDVAGPIEFGMAFGLAGAGSAVTSAGIPMWLTARF